MKNKGKILLSAGCGVLTIMLIILLRFVDVREIGPEGTSIGLSHLNQFFFDLTGLNIVWYDITDWIGLTAIATAFVFAVAGLVQLIKRKRLLMVDKELLCLGALYIVVIGLYFLFEKVIVNYRPVIMPGGSHPEASFPSSHTMIVCIILGSAMMMIKKYIKKNPLQIKIAGKWKTLSGNPSGTSIVPGAVSIMLSMYCVTIPLLSKSWIL